MSKTRTYRAWANMFTRCYNARHNDYQWYGAKGIRVCDRWKIFSNFLVDMGEVPKNLTLDRIDPKGDYSPNNCRWATRAIQSVNRGPQRHMTYYTFEDNTLHLSEWARRLGISKSALKWRIKNQPLDVALSSPKVGA